MVWDYLNKSIEELHMLRSYWQFAWQTDRPCPLYDHLKLLRIIKNLPLKIRYQSGMHTDNPHREFLRHLQQLLQTEWQWHAEAAYKFDHDHWYQRISSFEINWDGLKSFRWLTEDSWWNWEVAGQQNTLTRSKGNRSWKMRLMRAPPESWRTPEEPAPPSTSFSNSLCNCWIRLKRE